MAEQVKWDLSHGATMLVCQAKEYAVAYAQGRCASPEDLDQWLAKEWKQ